MKKIEAIDLYEGFNGINPKMIEEAEKYKKVFEKKNRPLKNQRTTIYIRCSP